MRIDLSRLRARLKKLSAPRRGKRLWAVADLQPRRVTAVLVAPGLGGQRPAVKHASTIEFDGDTPPPEALARLAQELRVGSERWALLLPREDYRVTVMDAPEVPPTELAQSLRWQLATTLDFPVDDATVDFMTIPPAGREPQDKPEIYAVAARGASVQTLAARCRQARLSLQVIDIRETAQRNMAALLEQPDELLVMVAFGESEVQITFNWQHALIMDRLIAERLQADDAAERRASACERIQLQLQRSLEAVRANHPAIEATRIIVAGAPEGFVEQLRAAVFDPVDALVPEAVFDLSRTPQLKDPQAFMQHFHALGVALREREYSA